MNVEELLFHQYKDQLLTSSQKFKKDISKNFKDVNCRDLYRRIVNYQIEKYGCALKVRNYEEYNKYNKEDLKQISIRAKQRRYDRRRKR